MGLLARAELVHERTQAVGLVNLVIEQARLHVVTQEGHVLSRDETLNDSKLLASEF